jgi:CPA2 family monovalent cation:H+ antiporter-2
MVVGRSDYSLRAASDALPMRDAFAVLFFVSIGMLLDPVGLVRDPRLAIAALVVVLIAKPLVALLIVWALRYPIRVSLTVAIALAQIGEFSFILATVGRDIGIFTSDVTNALVAASIVSIVLNPVLYRAIKPIEQLVGRWTMRRALSGGVSGEAGSGEAASKPRRKAARHRAIVVGYGPTGRTVVRLLAENGITPTVIDLNVESVRSARQGGVTAIHGDATRSDVLEAAGIAGAGSLVLTSAGMEHSAEVIRAARDLHSGVKVLARVGYLRDLPALKQAGADTVYSGEGEVALAFVEELLQDLGATPEQIDRERDRAHTELFDAV